MTLGKLIHALEQLPPGLPVAAGFGKPMSYRGDYAELAFEPVEHTSIEAMLAYARAALGQTFTGYKGGKYTMDETTPCWLAEYGEGYGEQITQTWLDCLTLRHQLDSERQALIARAEQAERELSIERDAHRQTSSVWQEVACHIVGDEYDNDDFDDTSAAQAVIDAYQQSLSIPDSTDYDGEVSVDPTFCPHCGKLWEDCGGHKDE